MTFSSFYQENVILCWFQQFPVDCHQQLMQLGQCTFFQLFLFSCHQPTSSKFFPITYQQHSFAWSTQQHSHVWWWWHRQGETRLCAFESDSLNNEICSNLLPTMNSSSSVDFHFAAAIISRYLHTTDLRMLTSVHWRKIESVEANSRNVRVERRVDSWHVSLLPCSLLFSRIFERVSFKRKQHLLHAAVKWEYDNFCRVCE